MVKVNVIYSDSQLNSTFFTLCASEHLKFQCGHFEAYWCCWVDGGVIVRYGGWEDHDEGSCNKVSRGDVYGILSTSSQDHWDAPHNPHSFDLLPIFDVTFYHSLNDLQNYLHYKI